jgi:hypothetical protein
LNLALATSAHVKCRRACVARTSAEVALKAYTPDVYLDELRDSTTSDVSNANAGVARVEFAGGIRPSSAGWFHRSGADRARAWPIEFPPTSSRRFSWW